MKPLLLILIKIMHISHANTNSSQTPKIECVFGTRDIIFIFIIIILTLLIIIREIKRKCIEIFLYGDNRISDNRISDNDFIFEIPRIKNTTNLIIPIDSTNITVEVVPVKN